VELNKTVNLLYQIQNVYHKLALLQFWQEYPEIESVTVDCTFEYDDEGGYYPILHTKINLHLTRSSSEITSKLFPTVIQKLKMTNGKNGMRTGKMMKTGKIGMSSWSLPVFLD
jgi:hypothetical protein